MPPTAPASAGADAAAAGVTKPGASLAQRALGYVKAFFSHWSEDECGSRAASLSFYTAFSLAPILLLVLLVGSLVVEANSMRQQVLGQVTGLLGQQGGEFVGQMLDRAQKPAQGWAAVFAFLVLVFGATTAFAQLKDSLDVIFDSPAAKSEGFWTTIRTRLLSFGLILTLAFLALVSTAASAVFAGLSGIVSHRFGWEELLLGKILSTVIALVGSFVLFYVIYRLMPTRRLPRRALLFGAAVTTVLFAIGRFIIGAYLSSSDAVSSFGAAGSLAVILLWVNYSAMVFFAGAEISNLYTLHLAQANPQAAKEEKAANEPFEDRVHKLEVRLAHERKYLRRHIGDVLLGLRPRVLGRPLLLATAATAGGYAAGRLMSHPALRAATSRRPWWRPRAG